GGHREPVDLTPEQVRDRYGIPLRNQRHFQSVADEENLVIDVRPTNPYAVSHLERGAIPKPRAIKPKTINDQDVLLGAKPENRGLVGFFEPHMPPRGSMSEAEHAALQARHDQRLAELDKYGPKMDELSQKTNMRERFEVHDGVVHGYDSNGVRQPVAGD